MHILTAKVAKGLRKGRKGLLVRVSAFFAFFFLALFAVSFFTGCAQMLIPNGGDKDVTPPKVVKYLPDSAATNFKGKEITIVFNEYIQLKDVNNQLIVSPPLEEQPEIKLVKNHILNITFKKPLKENTTYTMNFGSAIADYNESNVLDNFQYVFSTGSFIDSLSLGGKVEYAFDHKTGKGILVMLYDDLSDSAPYKVLPSYFTKTKPDGSYKINNIRAGKYKVFALKDENRNYKYDAAALEVIGFPDQPVEISKNASVDLELFRELPPKLKLKSKTVLGYGHILFVLNKPAEALNVKALNVTKIPSEVIDLSMYPEFSSARDTVQYWFEGVTVDSLKLQLLSEGKPFDTANVRLLTKDQMNKSSKGEKLKLIISSNVAEGQKFDLQKEIYLKFNHPVSIDTYDSGKVFSSRMKIFEDTSLVPANTIRVSFPYPDVCRITFFKTDTIKPGKKDAMLNQVNVNLKEGKKYKISIPANSIKDIFGTFNDTFNLHFTMQEERFYGTLKLKLSLPEKRSPSYILQFLDSKENVIQEIKLRSGKTIPFDYLAPGGYKLRVIYDSNENGKWDPGHYSGKTQPEKVIYYSQPITVRSNWDLDVEWKVLE